MFFWMNMLLGYYARPHAGLPVSPTRASSPPLIRAVSSSSFCGHNLQLTKRAQLTTRFAHRTQMRSSMSPRVLHRYEHNDWGGRRKLQPQSSLAQLWANRGTVRLSSMRVVSADNKINWKLTGYVLRFSFANTTRVYCCVVVPQIINPPA